MAFKISKAGIDLIKEFEGCRLKAYLCPANVWTIGWGTTGMIDGVKIGTGMTITQAKADSLLINNLKTYENAVNKSVTYAINQNQYDALVSFTYNCGVGALQRSTLLKLLNMGYVKTAADQLDQWNKGGGRVLNGLVRRRTAEKKLFLTPWIEIKEDTELLTAVKKLVTKKIITTPKAWESLDKIKLEYVPALLKNMGGVDRLIHDKIITDKLLWTSGTYKPIHVKCLIIKYANLA